MFFVYKNVMKLSYIVIYIKNPETAGLMYRSLWTNKK